MVMQNNNIIIHIGLHKTGTTYLQYNFFPRLKNSIYIHGERFFNQWSNQSVSICDKLLISYEGFSGLPWSDISLVRYKSGISSYWIKSFEINIQNLKRAFNNPVIIVFFRRPGDLLLSMYKQYIHAGGVLSLHHFYGQGRIVGDNDLSILTRINLLDKNFESVYFLNYEKFKDKGDDYLIDFFTSELGLDVKKGMGKVIKANQGVKGWKLEALRFTNRFYTKIPRKLRRIIRYFRLSPRDFFQNHFSFIGAKESKYLNDIRQKVNLDFEAEWREFENKYQWKPNSD